MPTSLDLGQTGLLDLAQRIRAWAHELGFTGVGITDTELGETEMRLAAWLADGRHGEMAYMARHGSKRTRPAELVPGTVRVICLRMDYRPESEADMQTALDDATRGYIARYALGRDYHKLMRRRLQRLADRIEAEVGRFGYRAFVDSAPVMEKPLAAKAGLGWMGKHTNLLTKDSGGWFFLGELYTDLPLPMDAPLDDHCGSCTRCIEVCPTDAITAPYQLDARRCISYLTIELDGPIPVEFREAIGNRVFGCDDCQIHCPWNKFAQHATEEDFSPRHELDTAALIELFGWDEAEWRRRTEGSALRRPGYAKWLSNLAIGLGNAATHDARVALEARRDYPSAMVAEHVAWALDRCDGGATDGER
jgi:epoxyqueuosine reductase